LLLLAAIVMRTRRVGKLGARNDGITTSGGIQHKFFNGIQK
jgi:hypothetical protein